MNLQWSYIFPTLHILFSSVHLCEIPGGNVQKVNTLNLELLEFAEDASRELNPSVYLALRLSDRHDPEKEERYLQRLRDAFQPGNGSSTGLHYRKHPGTGRLALYLLSLRAACHDMKEEGHLITQLKQHLYKEIQHIGHKAEGHPVTNFYQFGLGVLALCVQRESVAYEDWVSLKWFVTSQQPQLEQFELRFKLLEPRTPQERAHYGLMPVSSNTCEIHNLLPDRLYRFTVKRAETYTLVYEQWHDSILLKTKACLEEEEEMESVMSET